MRLSDQIRAAVEGSGLTHYRLAKQAGIAQSVLSRFMRGESAITTDTLDSLAVVLDLQVSGSGDSSGAGREKGDKGHG